MLREQGSAIANSGLAIRERCSPSASPIPNPALSPSAIARFISRPVSSADPKRPSGNTASTSSLVQPGNGDLEIVDRRRAVHRECGRIAAIHQVEQHRRQPHLMTWPPIPQMICFPAVRAWIKASRHRAERIRRQQTRHGIQHARARRFPSDTSWRNARYGPCRRVRG